MRKLFGLLVILTLTVVLAACKTTTVENTGTGTTTAKTNTYEIAMITDIGTIDDESFNQGTWEGIKQYAEEKNITHKYYKPEGGTTTEYLDAIDLAVTNGAKIVVTPGFLFEEAIFEAQDEYEDVTFILIDGTPHDATYSEFRTEDNVYPILFAEHESGFLAGYAAVKDGYTKLGFMGGLAVPAVVKFGHGFLQGAEFAAKEMGLANDAITVKYNYLNTFEPAPEVQTLATSWYNDGTEVIFVAAGGAGSSVMNAANALDGKYVIGVDVDQSSKSTKVITSAMKQLSTAVYQNLTAIYNKDTSFFKPGETTVLNSANDGVGLPNDFSRFDTFTQADYDTIFNKLKNNTDNIRTNIDADTDKAPTALALDKVSVTVIE